MTVPEIHPDITPQVPGGPFDAILSAEMIEHIYAQDDSFIMVKAHVNAATPLIVTTPCHGWLKNVAIAVTGHWDCRYSPLWTDGYIKNWSRATLTALADPNEWRATRFAKVSRATFQWQCLPMVFRLAA